MSALTLTSPNKPDMLFLLLLVIFGPGIVSTTGLSVSQSSKCRFVPCYSQNDILTTVASDVSAREGRLHQNNVGCNTATGMTYEGTLLNTTTGPATEKHCSSAPDEEVLSMPEHSLQRLSAMQRERLTYPPSGPQAS